VWFPEGTNQAGEFVAHQVKDIRSGEQVDADPNAWVPQDAADLTPTVFAQA
jgi:histidyl-tRNA synthetase